MIEVKAKKVETAIEEGLAKLGTTRENVDIEIVSEGGGFLKSAVVRLTVKAGDAPSVATNFVNGLLRKMNYEADANLTESEEATKILITGLDSENVIGHHGDIIDSIQFLAKIKAAKTGKDFPRIVVDAAGYRERRKVTLTEIASKLASKAEKFGREVELDPMNSHDRLIIHTVLSTNENVRTESRGVEPNRYLVIIPKNQRRSGGERGERNGNNRSDRGGERGDRKFSGGYDRTTGKPYNAERKESNYRGYTPSYKSFEEDKPNYSGENFANNFKKQGASKFKSYGNLNKR
jgi:spoIIIJ-associated protein